VGVEADWGFEFIVSVHPFFGVVFVIEASTIERDDDYAIDIPFTTNLKDCLSKRVLVLGT
jgi:hypothetical protein